MSNPIFGTRAWGQDKPPIPLLPVRTDPKSPGVFSVFAAENSEEVLARVEWGLGLFGQGTTPFTGTARHLISRAIHPDFVAAESYYGLGLLIQHPESPVSSGIVFPTSKFLMEALRRDHFLAVYCVATEQTGVSLLDHAGQVRSHFRSVWKDSDQANHVVGHVELRGSPDPADHALDLLLWAAWSSAGLVTGWDNVAAAQKVLRER